MASSTKKVSKNVVKIGAVTRRANFNVEKFKEDVRRSFYKWSCQDFKYDDGLAFTSTAYSRAKIKYQGDMVKKHWSNRYMLNS
jgi:hypothetical protein